MSFAHCSISWRPISVEPVKESLRTSGLLVSSPPTAPAEPVTTLNTPAGIPARFASSASASAENGVWLAGFRTMVQPAASAGPAFAGDHRRREVPRRDGGGNADGLLNHQQALVGLVAGNGVAVDALTFFGEPLNKEAA